MNERQQRFIDLLKQIFEIDKADLDFGIYRILNIRRKDIQDFFTNKLPQQITEILTPFATKGADISALESDVYSALYSFFSRYYDEGDFISKRRYKEGVYAIPYEGEEVKLYWANQDQYYIKTAENFKDYTFKTENYTVHFRLVDATTEQNNNKETEEKKRKFMIFTEDEENYPGVKTFETHENVSGDIVEREYIIRFIYDVPEDPKAKWDEINFEAIREDLVKEPDTQLQLDLLRIANPEANKKEQITILQKHLRAYVAKNTFDYFIHKDLGGFLTRELDFFIKNEIMHLDDLDTENEAKVNTYLAKVRAIKRVGKTIISFLAQLENFQKKLWLKKKFVVETNWCITIDRIDEKFYDEICQNKAQIQEWIDMYAINEIETDLDHTEPWTDVPSILFLKQNQNLIVDTKHFSDEFKNKLIASIDNLDEETGGLMINSDNYQAIQLLSNCYNRKAQCLYMDPPYNTNEASFIYKNNYKHSSWAAMMFDRIRCSYNTLDEDGVLLITIDDEEVYDLKELTDIAIGSDKYIGTIVIQSNPRGRGINSYYATCHEYCLCYAKNPNCTNVIDQELTDEQVNEYKQFEEESYRLLPFRRSGGWSTPKDRPNSEFSLFFNDGTLIAVGGERITNASDEYIPRCIYMLVDDNKLRVLTQKDFDNYYPNAIKIMPIDKNGLRRVWRWSDRRKILIAGLAGDFVLKRDKEKYYVQLKDRIKDGRKPKTIWLDSKYDSSTHGTNLLKDIFGTRNVFGFPKSVYSTYDSLHTVLGAEDNSGIVIDLFGGSGTTVHALTKLNRIDGGKRKYCVIEMGEYFSLVTKPRIKKITYSDTWSGGKPSSRTNRYSHIAKYIRLESYEDALSNVVLKKQEGVQNIFGDDYLINYMLDLESKESLLNLEAFKTPFEYEMRITEKNECKEQRVDVCETFNYLIGLTVVRQGEIRYFSVKSARRPEYEGAVDLVNDANGIYAFRQIEGTLRDGRKTLIIWRSISDNLIESNVALDAYFTKYRINPLNRDYDVIYVNGDSNLENLRTDDESWKVVRTETEFNKRMFEEE